MALKWKALGEGPSPLEGNCGNGQMEFCRIQAARRAGVMVVDNPDPTRGPAKLFRYEVKFGDNVPGMSDCRSLSTGPGFLWVNNGTEEWWRWITRQPADWVGSYPKWDQLEYWPGISSNAGSGMEFHHEPFGGGVEAGSAPLYTGVAENDLWFKLNGWDPDPSIRHDLLHWSGPMKREFNHEWILHINHSWDPTVGFIELWVDGVNVIKKVSVATMFPNTRNYPVLGLYRNYNIGGHVNRDGNPLVWPNDAAVGVSYLHGFVPVKGQLVYPRDDGTPGAQMIGGLVTGSTLADVMDPYSVNSNVPTPIVVSTPGSTVPTYDPTKVEGWRLQLVAQRPQLEASIAGLTAALTEAQKANAVSIANVAALTAALAAEKKLLDDTVALLNRGA